MSSHTNVKIYDRYDSQIYHEKMLHDLRRDMEFYKAKYEEVVDQLANIPLAVEEWGRVDLYDMKGNLSMTLVKKVSET